MKKLLLILLCLHILGCGGGKKENTLTMHNIKGKVKEIIEREFNVKESFGDFQKTDLIYKFKYKYDKDGNQTEQSFYNKDGDLKNQYKYKYEYDHNNNWIVSKEYNNDSPYTIKEREINYY